MSVVVDINPGPPVMYNQSYQINNQSANGVYLAFIQKDKGYEDSVFSPPVGTILKPGETFRFELTQWFLYAYSTYFTFYGCFDESCGPSSLTTNEWVVQIRQLTSFGTDRTACLGTGWCSDGVGCGTNPGQYGGQGILNRTVNLRDTRAPNGRPETRENDGGSTVSCL